MLTAQVFCRGKMTFSTSSTKKSAGAAAIGCSDGLGFLFSVLALLSFCVFLFQQM
jgi:hypothetical protein